MNGRLVLRDTGVTSHAFARLGNAHVLAGIAIRVAIGAFQSELQMSFVAVWKRLLGPGTWIRDFVGGLLSRGTGSS